VTNTAASPRTPFVYKDSSGIVTASPIAVRYVEIYLEVDPFPSSSTGAAGYQAEVQLRVAP
jgi:hypothetical protein